MKHVTLQCPVCDRQITFTAPAWPVAGEGRGCLPCLLGSSGMLKVLMHTVEVRDLVGLEILVEIPTQDGDQLGGAKGGAS